MRYSPKRWHHVRPLDHINNTAVEYQDVVVPHGTTWWMSFLVESIMSVSTASIDPTIEVSAIVVLRVAPTWSMSI
jgi:hypothetical protein